MADVVEPDRERVIRTIAHPGEDHGLCARRHDAPEFQTVLVKMHPGLGKNIARSSVQIWRHRGSHVHRSHLLSDPVMNVSTVSTKCRDATSRSGTYFNHFSMFVHCHDAPSAARENEGAILFQRTIDWQSTERLAGGYDSVLLRCCECRIKGVMIDDSLPGIVEQEGAVRFLADDPTAAETAEHLNEHRL